jgi:putative hydrolase of the HAD superfamily
MPRWLLLDYGQVLCTAPPEDEWEELRQAAGYADADQFYDAYWEHRVAYDRGDMTAAEYWDQVAPGGDLERLRRLDVDIWLHQYEPSVAAATAAASRGWHLAVFSNAPVDVAAGIDALSWLRPVERRFYSCRIGRVKPELEAYEHVLSELRAAPHEVVFFDDRPVNVDAAAELGIEAYVFTDAAQIESI